jgi:cell fate regulator YaaT (PSP1 superfamily)
MPSCIGIRFDNGPKLHFVEAPPEAPAVGVSCVVSTRRGLELGVVRTEPRDFNRPVGYFVRMAEDADFDTFEALQDRAEDLKWLLKARAREYSDGIKIVSLEFNLNESLLIVSYSAEEQVPLRVLAQELMNYTGARVEFLNVGPRDQARILGTLGVCGDGSCSSTWLQTFSAVGIRMARDQQLPLNPEKISGPCGRLMCCLQYEHEMYEELLRALPRRGAHACHKTTGSCGRIGKLNPLKQTVELQTEDGGVAEYAVEELELTGR